MSGQRLEGPGRGPFLFSLGLHLVALVLVWWTESLQADPVTYEVIRIDLVSPPPAAAEAEEEQAPAEELVVETPAEEAPEPEPEDVPVPEQTRPDPPPRETREETPPPPEEPAEERTPATTTEPAEEPPEETGEGINVRLEGLRRDYPAYYNNIIRQIGRCFRPTGSGDLRATVRFHIERDGTVSDLSIVERSGDFAFDIEAMGAVECAGQRDRLGALPEDLPWDRLPVEFTFRPPGRDGPPDPIEGEDPALRPDPERPAMPRPTA